MGVEWSAENQEAINAIERGLKQVRSYRHYASLTALVAKAEAQNSHSSGGIHLFTYKYADASRSKPEWRFVAKNVLPCFYDASEDQPSKAVQWRLEIEAAEIDAVVDHSLELLADASQRRVTFRAGSIWAMKFPDMGTYRHFWSEFNNKLFENLFKAANTQSNREEILGREFAARLFTEESEEPMEWEDAQEEIKEEPVPEKSSRDAVTGEDEISLIKIGIGENSFIVRDDKMGVMRNVDSGIERRDTSFELRKSDGSPIKPSVVMLAEREKKLGMLDSEDATSLLYADIETGKVVQEWQFIKNGTEIPMTEIVPETKNAPAEERSTFLSFDKNRLCRWDTRDPDGVVQEYSGELDFVGGKDYARYTDFTCMATAGDGSVVVGSRDGKIRLYSNKLTLTRASTAFPGIGARITHIDVTFDGKWVVATTDHFIEVIKTTAKDSQGKTIDGFRKSLGAHASAPKLLKLKPEDTMAMKDERLKNGRFTFVTEANRQERWIVATCGNYSVLWNFRQVKSNTSGQTSHGGLPTFMTYHLVSKDERVVDSCFLHEAHQPTGSQSESALVVATPKNVWTFSE